MWQLSVEIDKSKNVPCESVNVTTKFAIAFKNVKLLKITNISMFWANLPNNIPVFSQIINLINIMVLGFFI